MHSCPHWGEIQLSHVEIHVFNKCNWYDTFWCDSIAYMQNVKLLPTLGIIWILNPQRNHVDYKVYVTMAGQWEAASISNPIATHCFSWRRGWRRSAACWCSCGHWCPGSGRRRRWRWGSVAGCSHTAGPACSRPPCPAHSWGGHASTPTWEDWRHTTHAPHSHWSSKWVILNHTQKRTEETTFSLMPVIV